ncbi:MAG: hypothetical protein M1812_005214 [Candelaria pacifica]|nr:MAG: hypothetical protein M1812_005214 [Candelaria pacifica]
MMDPSKYCEELLYQRRTGMPHKLLLSKNGEEEERCEMQSRAPPFPIGYDADHRSQRNIAPCSTCITKQWDYLELSYRNVPTDEINDYYKISLIGDRGVGKNSLSKRFCWGHCDEAFNNDCIRTKSRRVAIDGHLSEIEVFTPTHQEYTSSGVGWMPAIEGLILVYDVTSRLSFDSIIDACPKIKQCKTDQGFSRFPICILGNMCDRAEGRQVLAEHGRATAMKLGCYYGEVSSKTGEHVLDAFEDFTRVIRETYPQTFRHGRSKPRKTRILYPPTKRLKSKASSKEEAPKRYVKAIQLVRAARENRTFKLPWLLATGTNPNHQNGPDDSALYIAAAKGHRRIVRLLINFGAAVNAKAQAGMNPLQIAVINNHIDVVRLLIDRGALVEELTPRYGNALQAAATLGRLEIARLLLRSFANVNAYGGVYGTPLQAAVATKNLEMARLLLDWDAWVYLRGEGNHTPLEVAAYNGDVAISRLLMERGANVYSIPSVIGAMGIDIEEDDDAFRSRRGYPYFEERAVMKLLREAAHTRRCKVEDTWRKGSLLSMSLAKNERSVPPSLPSYSVEPSKPGSEATIAVSEAHDLHEVEKDINHQLPKDNQLTSSKYSRLYTRLKILLRSLFHPPKL